MIEILAPGRLASDAVVPGAGMIVTGLLLGQRFKAAAAWSPACTERAPARGELDQALVLSDCLSRTGNPRSIHLSVMNSTLTTETSLGRPSQEPE